MDQGVVGNACKLGWLDGKLRLGTAYLTLAVSILYKCELTTVHLT